MVVWDVRGAKQHGHGGKFKDTQLTCFFCSIRRRMRVKSVFAECNRNPSIRISAFGLNKISQKYDDNPMRNF